ncbi:MAG: hypothetical protein ACREAO_08665 [Nitrososphaera sp.]
MNFGRRQAKGIAGMGLTVLGGVAWFYQLYIPAVVAWGGVIVILMSLNKRKRRR